MYPIEGYPKITEFRAMLATLGPEGERRWNREYFLGYTAPSEEGKGKEDVSFRAHANAITFGSRRKSGGRYRRCFAAHGKSPRYVWHGMNWRSNTVNFDAALLRSGSFLDTPPQIGCCKAPRGALG